jgi:hypothetical protein
MIKLEDTPVSRLLYSNDEMRTAGAVINKEASIHDSVGGSDICML